MTTKARAAGRRDQTRQYTDPLPCAGVSAHEILIWCDGRSLSLIKNAPGKQNHVALLLRLVHKSSVAL